jgi:hypothetical protein
LDRLPEEVFASISSLAEIRMSELSRSLPEDGPAFVFIERTEIAIEALQEEVQQFVDVNIGKQFVIELTFSPPDRIECYITVKKEYKRDNALSIH